MAYLEEKYLLASPGDICELFIHRVLCFLCFVRGISSGSTAVNTYKLVSFESELNSPGNIHVGFYGHAFMLEKRSKSNWKEYFLFKKSSIHKTFRYRKTFPHLQWWWDLNHFRQG